MIPKTSIPDDSPHSNMPFDSEITFGKYMRKIRTEQGISLRTLAKEVGKTPTYISDIENGNNKPPDKELLVLIIESLHLSADPEIRDTFYDLAALERNDIPLDIKEYLLKNPQIIFIIRSIKGTPLEKDIWKDIQDYFAMEGK